MSDAKVLRELYGAVGYDDEACLPATVILRTAERRGINITPCVRCGRFRFHTMRCRRA